MTFTLAFIPPLTPPHSMNTFSLFGLGAPELILLALVLGVIFVIVSLVVGLIVSLIRSSHKSVQMPRALGANDAPAPH
jgi:vacuolar-type H+-ATPase subunit I/STV1